MPGDTHDTSLTLDQLAHRHGTDKASGRHNYTAIYERFLEPLRDRAVTLVEIGVKEGASVRMWQEYFPLAQIIGIDIEPKAVEHADERIRIIVGPQADPDLLDEVTDAASEIDIVIDDGSHRYEDQVATMHHLWPILRSGGIYVMEDIHTSYLDRYDMGFRRRETTVEFLKDLVDDVHVRYHRQATTLPGVESVQFFAQTCVVTKR